MIRPICVAWAVSVGEFARLPPDELDGSAAFARPKSSTFTVPSARTLMFAGFRSRWTMPASCAASSASAIWRAMGEGVRQVEGRGAADERGQILPVDQLHHDRVAFDPVDRRDVRMIERRERLRFAREAREPRRVVRETDPAAL